MVLDNCEHVAPAAAALCRTLLDACAGLRVLATSRQPLGVAGETVWRVPGLSQPDAVGLLADRASSAAPGHELAAGDAPLAAAVCRRLDALPLAIELVAGRLALLSLAGIADHLDRRLALLASAGPAAGRRHQTMRAAIDWSHELLEPRERAVLRRMAVFAGGFGPAAAEAVAADPACEPPAAAGEVLPLLMRLVDKSMVVSERVEDGTRYRLLETIREYGLERLVEAGEAAAARGRHALWYRELAGSVNPGVGATHVAELDQELANIRAALAWCLGEGATPDLALAIAAPLWWYWWMAGASDEGRGWLMRCLAAADAPTAARAQALRATAALSRYCGDNEEALSLGEESLAAYRAVDDRLGVAAALNGLCITASHIGDDEAALRYAVASLAEARAIGRPHGVATSANNLGTVLRTLGRVREAEDLHREALTSYREQGNRHGQGSALNNLGLGALRSGDTTRARQLALESLASYHEIRLAEGEMDAVVTIAAVEVAEGRPDGALLLLTVVGRERRRLGVAAPTRDEARMYESALAEALGALEEPRRTAVLAEAERTGLEAVLSPLLAAFEASARGN